MGTAQGKLRRVVIESAATPLGDPVAGFTARTVSCGAVVDCSGIVVVIGVAGNTGSAQSRESA
jgi:hypothetical protein